MLATLVLALLALFNFTFALTTPAKFRSYKSDCKALIEDTPWQITNLVTFQTNLTSKASNCSSYISFNFRDVNTGLELSTSCNRTVKAGGNETLSNGAYIPCESEDVNFIWENGVLSVERWYEDPCLGDYPYDSAIAYGHAGANLTMTKVSDGLYSTQTQMKMPITSMS